MYLEVGHVTKCWNIVCFGWQCAYHKLYVMLNATLRYAAVHISAVYSTHIHRLTVPYIQYVNIHYYSKYDDIQTLDESCKENITLEYSEFGLILILAFSGVAWRWQSQRSSALTCMQHIQNIQFATHGLLPVNGQLCALYSNKLDINLQHWGRDACM